MTPLLVIASFVSLTEVVAGLALTKANGTIQLILTVFVVVFPIAVAAAFFTVLWHRPYVLYGPTEFAGGSDVSSYVGAMKPAAMPSAGDPLEPTIVENEAVTAMVAAAPPTPTEQTTSNEPEDWFVLWRRKEYDAAVARLEQEVDNQQLEPAIAHAIAGRIVLDKNRAEGLAYFEAVFAKMPAEPEPYVWLGYAYMATGELDAALHVVDRGVAAGADETTLTIAKARFMAEKAHVEDAIGLLRSFDPTSANARVVLATAEICEGAGRLLDAQSALEIVLRLDRLNETALYKLAQVKAAASDNARALSLYRRLLEVNDTNPAYHTHLGNLYLNLDLPSKAMAAYEKANELAEGKQAWILANIGNLLKNRGLHHNAVSYLQRAIVLDPRFTYAHDRMTVALKGIEAEDEKETTLLNSARQDPAVSAQTQLGSTT
jgi:tetratricopeptide (TPR) repeat protein